MARSNAIASAVLDEFEKLATNRKPAVRANGVREWVPLCGIVAECMSQARRIWEWLTC